MGVEYEAKVFKSGNSVALRLPKSLGLKDGDKMVLRKEGGKYSFEPAPVLTPKKIDLTGIYGSIPGLTRMPHDEIERDWGDT